MKSLTIQSLVMGMMSGGAYGLADEFFSEKYGSGAFWIAFLLMVGVCKYLLNEIVNLPPEKNEAEEFFKKKRRKIFNNRMDAITTMANRNMSRVNPLAGRRHDNLWVTVPYDDLIRIWDISIMAKDDATYL